MSDTTLLTSVVETEIDGDGFRRISISGEPHAAAIVNAVNDNYSRVTGKNRPTLEELEAKIDHKVTLLTGGENMLGAGLITAREGRLIAASKGLGFLPKGARSKGFYVKTDRLLDVFDGWVTNVAEANVMAVRGQYPVLRNLTLDRLKELPGEDENDEVICSLAVFGEWRMPDCVSHDAIWLIGEYWPEEDICDRGVLLIRPEHGISEHGSVYGRQLLQSRAVGEIVGFEPIPYGEAMALCDLDFDEASAIVFGRAGVIA